MLYEADLRQTYSARYTTEPEGGDGVRQAADRALDSGWDMIEAVMAARDDGPYLLGGRFTMADIELAMIAGWHHDLPALFARCPHVKRLVDAVRSRPAIAPLWALHYGKRPEFQDNPATVEG